MNDNFNVIDFDSWARKDEYNHFTVVAPCSFTMTADVDITSLYEQIKFKNAKLYPALVALTAQVVNEHKEFRYALNREGKLGYYDVLHPLFFGKNESDNVKVLCAEYDPDAAAQIALLETERKKYEDLDAYAPQPSMPLNTVNISCEPWVRFTGLSFNLPHSTFYFFPIIAYGRYEKKDGKVIIPLAAHFNHAVNDGYHASVFFDGVQKKADSFKL